MPFTKALTFDGIVRRSEMVADVAQTDVLYHLINALGYDNADLVEWKVPTGTVDTLINPSNMTTASGLIIRINRKKEETNKRIKVRLESDTAPLIPVSDLLVLVGTQITQIYVSNDSGNTVETIIHFFG
jgi:hypothetical protein